VPALPVLVTTARRVPARTTMRRSDLIRAMAEAKPTDSEPWVGDLKGKCKPGELQRPLFAGLCQASPGM